MVKIKDLHKGTEEEVPKVETGADQRALGVQVNMERCWSGAGGQYILLYTSQWLGIRN